MSALSLTVSAALDYLMQTAGLADPPPDVGVSGVRKDMAVFAACGQQLGVVDRLDGTTIQLTRRDSPDGRHHFLPVGWVERVDDRVHLTHSLADIWQQWLGQSNRTT